jgi:tetratricopeptide (TPR) repeat protein
VRDASRPAFLLLLIGAACASAGGGRGRAPAVAHQADERLPPLSAFEAGDRRIAYNDALTHEQKGWRAESAGDVDAARAPLEAAARSYLVFVERYPDTGWDVTLRYHAVDLLRRAKRYDEAAALAEQVVNDPRADAKSRAMAWLQAANARVGAGEMVPLRIAPSQERRDAVASPRTLPEPWKRFVEATDAHLQSLDPARPEPEDRLMSAAQLALVAARVSFASDDMPGARRRLAAILERWPQEPQVFQGAAPLYVQTFLRERDYAGADEAIARVRDTAGAQARGATDADARAAYEKVSEEAGRVGSGIRFEQAKSLLEEGKAREAAEAFEAIADAGGDVAAALSGAAVAWDRAEEGDRAAELRRRILEEHGDSKVALQATLQLAAYLSKKGDHAGAGRTYAQHAERWPDDPNHCVALRNGAVELDRAKQRLEAAEHYRTFGGEPRCAEASPDVAVLALHRAGQLYLDARKRTDARDAFQAAAAIEGVTTPDAKRRVSDARAQAKRLGAAAGRRTPKR